MDAIEAIRSRRMLPKMGPDRPSREEIAELLELAVRAPNHHLTQPWRFYVLAGDERERLARAIADDSIARGVAEDDAVAEGRRKVSRAPVIIAVTCLPSDAPEVEEQEELASVAMAIQNLLLAAYAKGLAAMLRTGTVAYGESTRDRLGFSPDERVVGFVYLGRPGGERAQTERTSATEFTQWLGWDDAER